MRNTPAPEIYPLKKKGLYALLLLFGSSPLAETLPKIVFCLLPIVTSLSNKINYYFN